MTVDAVIFDLDDTLFPQERWLAGAWDRVADAAETFGVDRARMLEELHDVASEGSGRGRIIDRALERCGASDVPTGSLVDAFRSHEGEVELYPGVRERLRELRGRVKVALVTDGDPHIQKSKLRALDIEDAFDAIVLSDELGRAKRKPHPAPFFAALRALSVDAARAVFIGDRPDKDVTGASRVGMRAVRVRTGEYANARDEITPWRTAPDVVAAIDVITRA